MSTGVVSSGRRRRLLCNNGGVRGSVRYLGSVVHESDAVCDAVRDAVCDAVCVPRVCVSVYV